MDLDKELLERVAARRKNYQESSARAEELEHKRQLALEERDRLWTEIQELSGECARRLLGSAVQPERVYHVRRNAYGKREHRHEGEYAWADRAFPAHGQSRHFCIRVDGLFFMGSIFLREDPIVWDKSCDGLPAIRSTAGTGDAFIVRNGRIVWKWEDHMEHDRHDDVVSGILDLTADLLAKAE